MKMLIPAVLGLALASGASAAPGSGAQELHEHMTKSSQEMQSMEMTGDLDRDFVKTMIQHHRHGVEMAQIQLEHGKDAKAKEFAQKIVDAQTKEIKQLEGWLQRQPQGPGEKR